MKKINILLIITLILFGCNKQKVSRGTPRCVQQKIEEFATGTCTDGVKVDEYTFQNKVVYVFIPGTCGADMTSEVIDQDCNTLGYLGGITGNTMINGEDFANAIFVKTIWEK